MTPPVVPVVVGTISASPLGGFTVTCSNPVAHGRWATAVPPGRA
jgi:hypothetical protein